MVAERSFSQPNHTTMAHKPHFLVVTFPFQGHINPALRLAKRLACTDALVTFSTTVHAHRRMFPSRDAATVVDGDITYLPFSDGTENGYQSDIASFNGYMASFHESGSRSLSEIIESLAADGRPVSCVVYTLLLPWAADVARAHDIASALYWIQPAAVFAIYYHYYHGHNAVVANHRHDPSFTVHFPGLSPHKICDLPSFITTSSDESDCFHSVFLAFRDLFRTLDEEKDKATILVNTFQELEERELVAVDAYNILPIGPLVPIQKDSGSGGGGGGNLFMLDEKKYMEWLDTKQPKSVVYVSFGSLSVVKKVQLEELLLGLEESKMPYLGVVRKDNRSELTELEMEIKNGIVVEWCDQVKVLSHPAVGCFVTHCGWNSVLESLACGVPMVGAPRLSDQAMNARLVERTWQVGARAEIGEDGVLRRGELRRCVEAVMVERVAEMRCAAEAWKERTRAALDEGGSSDRNLMVFIESVRNGV